MYQDMCFMSFNFHIENYEDSLGHNPIIHKLSIVRSDKHKRF